jgi:hypothetical protein
VFIDPGPPRRENQWAALMMDFTAPAHKSDWGRRVSDRRIVLFDRVRPHATRAVLLAALVAILVVLDVPHPWLVALLVMPAVVQVVLEIVLEPIVRADVIDSDQTTPFIRSIVRFWVHTYEKLPVNLTGLIGTCAVIANIVAVEFFTGTHGPGWLRLAAFVVAVLYCCSGVLAPLLDPCWHSPLDETPAVVGNVVKPYLWCIVLAILAGSVLTADWLVSPWADGSVPYALMACGLSYYIGLRVREYERDVAAAAAVMALADAEERQFIAAEMHDRFQPAKHGLARVIDAPGLLAADQRSALRIFFYDMEELYRQAKTGTFHVGDGFRPPIRNRVREICEAGRLDYRGSVFDLEDRVDQDNYRLAANIVTTLAHNCLQAYQSVHRPDMDTHVSVMMRLDDEATAIIEIGDRLDLIPEHIWHREDTTLAALRRTLEERRGSLSQHRTEMGKVIRAQWIVHLQPVREANLISAKER